MAGAADLSLSCTRRKDRARRNVEDFQPGRGNDFDRPGEACGARGVGIQTAAREILPNWAHRTCAAGKTTRDLFRKARAVAPRTASIFRLTSKEPAGRRRFKGFGPHTPVLSISTATFQEPSFCSFQMVTYFPFSSLDLPFFCSVTTL